MMALSWIQIVSLIIIISLQLSCAWSLLFLEAIHQRNFKKYQRNQAEVDYIVLSQIDVSIS